MRHALLLATALLLAGLGAARAQDQSGELNAWVASPWAQKAEFLSRHGAKPERACEMDPNEPQGCWTTTSADVAGCTLTMMSGEGDSTEATFYIEKIGGMHRFCQDDETWEKRKFFGYREA